MATLDPEASTLVLRSHIAQGGHCTLASGHEPKNPPAGAGEVAGAVWFSSIGPTGANTGLDQSDALMVLTARFYLPMLTEPQDEIDPRMTAATIDLMRRVSADFTLGGTVDWVDLLGQTGRQLEATAGYVELGRQMNRAVDVTIPAVVYNVWGQTP